MGAHGFMGAHGSHGPPLGSLGTHQGPRTKDRGPRTKDQGPRTKTQKDFMLTLFWPERASYKSCEVLDTTIPKLVTRSSVLDGSQPIPEGLRGGYKGSKVGPWDDFWKMF